MISLQFAVGSCVRQVSRLSSVILNVFVNVFIVEFKNSTFGCHVCQMFVGCLLYADDIILLSPTVGGLRAMLDKCFEISCVLSLKFNVCKSHFMIIGRMSKTMLRFFSTRVINMWNNVPADTIDFSRPSLRKFCASVTKD